MMHGNGSPLGIRKTIQLMVILTILAWATQTLLAQWGFSAEAPRAQLAPSENAEAPREVFVPVDRTTVGGTLELRGEATITGTDVMLKQLCRWSDRDKATFSPIADLVVLRLAPKTSFQSIGVAEIKSLLQDAGVSLAAINFVGAASCTIDRTDVKVDEDAALQQWLNAKHPANESDESTIEKTDAVIASQAQDAWRNAESAQVALASNGPTIDPAAPAEPGAAPQEFRNLRQILITDLGGRLNIDPDDLQMHFAAKDEKLLALSEPHFRFQIDPLKQKSLGTVHWDVTVVSDNNGSQNVSIAATARLWQDQVVIAQPVAMKQIIQEGDIADRRTLVDRIDTDAVLTRAQVIGNQATRDLKPGTVMTGKLVDPVPLARTGQFVTVTVISGKVKVKTVARAMETGTYGQTIRVKNEATKDVYEVVLTGPQTAEMNPRAGDSTSPTVASIQPE